MTTTGTLPPPQHRVAQLLARLVGKPARIDAPLSALDHANELLCGNGGIGLSQFNELLLLHGYDRCSQWFFQYLLDGHAEYEEGASCMSYEQLESGVERFRISALIFFGNIPFAYQYLRLSQQEIQFLVERRAPRPKRSFERRHTPIRPVRQIEAALTPLLGYLSLERLQARAETDPGDASARAMLEKVEEVRATARRNFEAYLSSDHLDVYVATSMREPADFMRAHRFVSDVLASQQLKRLKLRWFDPTQADCGDRIDKGLQEALMLKRAKCTLYLAQESDTLGKDSELACTLAQGKPVIAYVPSVESASDYYDERFEEARLFDGGLQEAAFAVEMARIHLGSQIWIDASLRALVDAGSWEELKARVVSEIPAFYDRRANLLANQHPLGLQVHLENGVANGVLVARTVHQCIELVLGILTKTLSFDIEEEIRRGQTYLLLRERRTKCVFRVATGDFMLTNSFWNFYLFD